MYEDGTMNAIHAALSRLRASDPVAAAAIAPGPLASGIEDSGVRFAAVGGPLEERWTQALRELSACIHPFAGSEPTLSEGGVYHGAWIESTATINTEVLSRFAPAVTRATHELFATHQRPDGLMPYKVTADGPGYGQIQIVTPLARSVWNHYLLTGRDRSYLRTMFDAMARMDSWLASNRDTRGTDGVEAFCTFDTGHDLSPRFWGVADRCPDGDASRYDTSNPLVPFIAPDLTANVACQRRYLAIIAEELDEDPAQWRERADVSEAALWSECFDEPDGTFYDRDATGAPVRVQSDVLLRVLACEIGDDTFFTDALNRYLMNTGKFFAGYGFTSIALDDPRFDRDFSRNSWGGPSNYLSAIRAPHAFEAHGRFVELGLATMPLLAAATVADRFPQCVDPWSGEPGFTETYSPAIAWFIDAVERSFGIMPRPTGELWISTLTPTRLDHGAAATAVAYSRTHDGVRYEVAADDSRAEVWRNGELWIECPRGWRLVLGAAGELAEVVGLVATGVPGQLRLHGVGKDVNVELDLEGNQRVAFGTDALGTDALGTDAIVTSRPDAVVTPRT